jgi:ABC-2 type transport system ATP-binding protein
MVNMTALIELKNLTKDYGNFRALSDVNLTIHQGITGLLGPNGAGKSTLIKVLLGLVRTSSGTGHVLGFPLGEAADQVRTQIGYMPEDDCYVHGLSGIESIQVAARLSRMPNTEALRRGHEILDFCGAGQERYRLVETYSTGMRQKLRFAMAIVHDPKLLILDEPTSGLDPEEREAMLNRIRILARDFHKSVILCTHILPDVKTVCDRVVILAQGSVRVNDTLETLCRMPDPSVTVAVTGDSRAFNEILVRRNLRSESVTPHQLRVVGEAGALNTELWSAAAEAKCVIRSLTPSRNSLEQIFLDAVREGHRANS